VELQVSDLARRSNNTEYPYESAGIKKAADPIHIDSGDVYKGTLHYVAEFLPALALKGVKFEERSNELQQAVEDDDGDEVEAVVDDSPPIPEGITARAPISAESMEKTNETPDSLDSVSAHTADSNDVEPVHEFTEIGREELLHHQSGIIVFNVLSGQLAKKARLEVLLDDGYWPAFATVKSRSTSARWDHVGEGFVKELDVGKVWLRLDESTNEGKEDIIAEWKGDAKAFLQSTLVCQ
jgi:Ca2+-dependent lipid-binding protein